MLPLGPILLVVLLVLLGAGFFPKALQSLGLRRRAAILLFLAILAGSGLNVSVTPQVTLNLGATLLPLGMALYLLITCRRRWEWLWALAGAAVTAGAIYVMGRWFPPGMPTELNLFSLDAQYLYGLVGGLTGYATCRSDRISAVAGCLGVLLADLAHALLPPVEGVIRIGGGGFFGTAVVAAVLALALARWLGEQQAAPTVAGQP